MVDFFYLLYINVIDRNRILKKIRFYSLLRYIIRKIANIILPIYFKITQTCDNNKLSSQKKKNNRIIISLTSFPARINKVWLVIETLLRQSYKPDIIVLWLSKEQFKDLKCLPLELLKQQSRGLMIRMVDGDIRSHKKYYYTLKEYPNDILVTADDDIFYDSNWLKILWEKHILYPNSIICSYGYKIMYDENNNLMKYRDWKPADIYDINVFFGSGGGVLFPINSFYKDVTNIYLAMQLCPLADDVWLNTMVRLKCRQIIKVSSCNIFLPILNPNKVALSSANLYDNFNDTQLNNVIAHYGRSIGINPYQVKQ